MKGQVYTSELVFVGGKLKYVPIGAKRSREIDLKYKKELKLTIASESKQDTPKINKGNCKSCYGYGYFPMLFEDNLKCPHCDKNGNVK